MADEGLSRRQVGVRLDPHRAHRLDPPVGHALAHLLEEPRILLLHPGVLLSLRADEDEVRLFLHQPEGGGEGAGAFAAGFSQGPKPGRVDVGMADGGDDVAVCRCRCGEERRPYPLLAEQRVADVIEVDGECHPVERPEDLEASPLAGAGRIGQLGQKPQVVPGGLQLVVPDGELRPVQAVEGSARRNPA